MLRILLLSLFHPIYCYTVYEKPWHPELFQPTNSLNPQGWASHNLRDTHPQIQKDPEFSNKGTAMLPSLLVLNPKAKTVFENLSFFANPQFTFGHRAATNAVNFHRLRTIRRHPSALTRVPQKREILMSPDKQTIGLMQILRQAIMDYRQRSAKQFFSDKQPI